MDAIDFVREEWGDGFGFWSVLFFDFRSRTLAGFISNVRFRV